MLRDADLVYSDLRGFFSSSGLQIEVFSDPSRRGMVSPLFGAQDSAGPESFVWSFGCKRGSTVSDTLIP